MGRNSTFYGALVALFSGMSFGSASVLVRLSLRKFNPLKATILSLMGSICVVIPAALIIDYHALITISVKAILVFGIVGILNFPLGRYFNYLGINYIGAARSVTLRSGSPLFATALACLWLRENPSMRVILGTILMVGGIALVVSESQNG